MQSKTEAIFHYQKGEAKDEPENEAATIDSKTESEMITNGLIEEEESEVELIQINESEDISPLDVKDKIIDNEATDEMQDAPLSVYTPITEPDGYTFDDYGNFLIDTCPKLGLNGEAAALALTRWLSDPSPFTNNMQLQLKNNSILDVWKFFEKIPRYRDLAIFAQILLTNNSSEASCEREFWKQRKIVTKERNRTGQELAFTRIVFMTAGDE